jgi:hypothetical protein
MNLDSEGYLEMAGVSRVPAVTVIRLPPFYPARTDLLISLTQQ